jgi:glycosyltransferase involved in cell wall biosynthesis
MKITHWSNWAINRSGLFHCAAEQVKFERRLGIDSQLAITEKEFPTDEIFDGWLKPVSWKETEDSTLWIVHRGIPAKLMELKIPRLVVIHGNVEFLVLEEIFSHAEKQGINTHVNLIKDSDASVAVNPKDYDIWKLYDPGEKLNLIPDAIDCEKYTIEGNCYPYFHRPQILWADSLRPNKFPMHIIWAMNEIVKKIPDARLTVVGLDLLGILTFRNLILRSPNNHLAANIENIQLLTNDNPSYMRGADILFNSNISGIYSRTELEAMACGCQVVGYGDFTKWQAKPFDIKSIAEQIINCWNEIKNNKEQSRLNARQYVLDNHNMEKQVKEKYIPLYNKVLSEKK